MANIVFNVAKGRVAGYADRVKNNDPANSALVLVALKASGLEADATLQDYADLGTLLAASNDEATNSGYARKVIDDATIGTPVVVDNTNDRVDVTIPDQTWSAVQATGGAIGALVLCYDSDTTSGTDSNIVPLCKFDFAVTPDGSDITASVTAPGVFRAS